GVAMLAARSASRHPTIGSPKNLGYLARSVSYRERYVRGSLLGVGWQLVLFRGADWVAVQRISHHERGECRLRREHTTLDGKAHLPWYRSGRSSSNSWEK